MHVALNTLTTNVQMIHSSSNVHGSEIKCSQVRGKSIVSNVHELGEEQNFTTQNVIEQAPVIVPQRTKALVS